MQCHKTKKEPGLFDDVINSQPIQTAKDVKVKEISC